MKKYKVGVCGHFGIGKNYLDGQTIKTLAIWDELLTHMGDSDLLRVDTLGWKKKCLLLFWKCFLLNALSDNIVILPAQKGVKVFVPLFVIINRVFHRKLHYIVVGGWLPNMINDNKWLLKYLKQFNSIFVEKKSMIADLKLLGIDNVFYLPNFKNIKPLSEDKLIYNHSEPFRLCVLSRIEQKKGIEDAINVVSKLNISKNRICATLDIYGPIDPRYGDRFFDIIQKSPEYIQYRGTIEYSKTVDVVKEYYILLFPTKYYTEGIPGTIIDAYASGVPVLASDWLSSRDIISIGETGILYDFGNVDDFEKQLVFAINNPTKILKMKTKCLQKGREYSPESFYGIFKEYLA